MIIYNLHVVVKTMCWMREADVKNYCLLVLILGS